MRKSSIVIHEEKIFKKFFLKKEITSVKPLDYKFIKRKKVIVFVPQEFERKLLKAMASAGAGKIGNYEMCSFQIEGTGTYIPVGESNPYKGNANRLSREKEIRLEMECGERDANHIIDAIMKVHPYEEVVYEIYDFSKRVNESEGAVITLIKSLSYTDLINRLNSRIINRENKIRKKFRRIAVINDKADEINLEKCRLNKVDCIITVNKNNINLIIIK